LSLLPRSFAGVFTNMNAIFANVVDVELTLFIFGVMSVPLCQLSVLAKLIVLDCVGVLLMKNAPQVLRPQDIKYTVNLNRVFGE